MNNKSMSNISIICGVYDEGEVGCFIKKNPQRAANNHQLAILNGIFSSSQEATVFSVPFVPAYPSGFGKALVSGYEISWEDNKLKFLSSGKRLLNLPGIRFLFRLIKAFSLLKRSISPQGSSSILVYGAHTPFLLSALAIKFLRKNICIIVLITDLPEYMGQGKSKRNVIMRFMKHCDATLQRWLIRKFDRYILLTEPMYDRLGIRDKDFLVEEGVIDTESLKQFESSMPYAHSDYTSFVYSGGLSERNGVRELLNAFAELGDQFKLLICGYGELENEVALAAAQYENIEYLGFLSSQDLYEVYRRVDAYINPRGTNHGDFVRYSFPSKMMEYLASGKPVFSHFLKGMPTYYKGFIFEIDGNSSQSIVDAVLKFRNLEDGIIQERCSLAREVIIRNKNHKEVASRILDFVASADVSR